MRYNHYGVIVDSEVPVIGVVPVTTPEWLQEDIDSQSIDLGWLEHLKSCPKPEHYDCERASGCYLIGFEVNDDDEFCIDDGAEYSAVIGETYCFVHKSRWVQRCALCSPCFPGQGDLESKGDYLTYTLPPEIWGDEEVNEKVKIKGGGV